MERAPITIGLFGQMKHGKSTVARLIQSKLKSRYNHNIYIRPFAKGIKDIVKEVYGMEYPEIEQHKQSDIPPKGWNMTMREALQRIGTECFRSIKDSTWIDQTLRTKQDKIIDDGRFINEANAIQDAKGVNILVYRFQELNWTEHPSEAEMFEVYRKLVIEKNVHGKIVIQGLRMTHNPFTILLNNCGDMDSLEKSVDIITAQLAKRYGIEEPSHATG